MMPSRVYLLLSSCAGTSIDTCNGRFFSHVGPQLACLVSFLPTSTTLPLPPFIT